LLLSEERHGACSNNGDRIVEPLTVTVAGARSALGIGTTKLYELINEGQLRTVKLGRRTLVRTDSIHALLDRLTNDPLRQSSASLE
jgi:excisionase family DNA binding protein